MSAKSLPGNPHAEQFRRSVDEFGESVISHEGQTDATIVWTALTDLGEAILANAYEQRTANLLSLWANDKRPGDPEWIKVHNGIIDRLGLLKNVSDPAPVKHFRTGPGKCNCGYDAYQAYGIMLDYGELLDSHLRRNR